MIEPVSTDGGRDDSGQPVPPKPRTRPRVESILPSSHQLPSYISYSALSHKDGKMRAAKIEKLGKGAGRMRDVFQS